MKHSTQRSTALNAIHTFLRLTSAGSPSLETLPFAPGAMRAALHTRGEAELASPTVPDWQMSLFTLLGAKAKAFTDHAGCHAMRSQRFHRRAMLPLSLSIPPRPTNSLDSAEPH